MEEGVRGAIFKDQETHSWRDHSKSHFSLWGHGGINTKEEKLKTPLLGELRWFNTPWHKCLTSSDKGLLFP